MLQEGALKVSIGWSGQAEKFTFPEAEILSFDGDTIHRSDLEETTHY
jgi:hypothetical protein